MNEFKLLILTIAFVGSLLAPSQAAPKRPLNTYDQRQDGKYNVHAKLDNFFIIVAPSSSADTSELETLLQNGMLAAQGINLKNIDSRVSQHPEEDEEGKPDEKEISLKSSEESSITRINQEQQPSVSKILTIIKQDSPTSSHSLKKTTKKENSGDSEGLEVEEKSSSKTARSLVSSGEVSKLPPKDASPLENKLPETGDSVGPADGESQELRLLGDGIENCGPERFRDRFGICRSRVHL